MLAIAYGSSGRVGDADKLHRRAIHVAPHNIGLKVNYGSFLVQQGIVITLIALIALTTP